MNKSLQQLMCQSSATCPTWFDKRQNTQHLTFGQVMYSQSNLGEVSGADFSSQLVKPHPPSKCQIIHYPLWMGQIIHGLPQRSALHHFMLLCHVLLCLRLFPHLWGCQGEDLFLTWRCLGVSPWEEEKVSNQDATAMFFKMNEIIIYCISLLSI